MAGIVAFQNKFKQTDYVKLNAPEHDRTCVLILYKTKTEWHQVITPLYGNAHCTVSRGRPMFNYLFGHFRSTNISDASVVNSLHSKVNRVPEALK